MKVLLLCFLLGSTIVAGCHKNNDDNGGYLKAKVVITKDLSCGFPVIDFSEDSVKIRRLTGVQRLRYTAINLPADYIVQDKKLFITVAIPGPAEDYFCTAMGIWYPHLKTLKVKGRN